MVSACRGFCSVPGALQTDQRAELWGVILALQANDGVHLGVDNLGVVRHVGRILDGRVSSRPCELLPDGSLRISKVKGHADEAMVRASTVRGLDKLGNDGADESAYFGRRRVPWWVTDARRNFSGVCSRWRPIVLSLHRFFIAICRAVVNHDGGAGTSIDPLVWSAGSAPKKRRVAVRDRASLPGPLDIWAGAWVGVAVTLLRAVILKFGLILLACWSSGLLFFILCIGLLLVAVLVWVVCVMWSCSFCMSFGRVRGFSWRRLFLGTVDLVAQFQCRLFLLVQALIFGLRRFVPCDIGANHCRLRHIGWERCGHGLTSRPQEFASEVLLWLSEWVCRCVIGWSFAPSVLFCQVCLSVP